MTQENIPERVVLGRYELLASIGQGGFATVYRAHDRKMDRQVALKAVPRTEELSGRAAREAQAAAKLGHPHIITVFELAEDERNIYIVSELVEGVTLAQCLRDGALTDRDCVRLVLQCLNGLEHAHNRGVVHRDIKPENIMVTSDREPQAKLMDFGIAQLENAQRITRKGDVIGTLAYMSPEQADGRAVDSASDVYSVALTLYESLAGANPFYAGTAAETLSRIHAGAAPLGLARPELPRGLSHLLEEAMEPEPGLRLSIRRLAAGLEEILPDMPVGEPATGIMRKTEPVADETRVLRRSEQRRSSAREELAGRSRLVAARAANAVLAAALAGTALYASAFYPLPWRLPLLLACAGLVAAMPRIGLLPLAAVAVLPIISFSPALGAMAAGLAVLYFLLFGLTSPRTALLPVLAGGLGWLGLGLVYPAVCGTLGRWRTGLSLALLGGAAFTAMQLFFSGGLIDYLGVANSYGTAGRLAGVYNPVEVMRILADPLRAQPVIALQPVIWMAAAAPAALIIRGRNLAMDTGGLVLADAVLTAGYLLLPYAVSSYTLPQLPFLKTLLVCVIIQIVLLLISPRIKLLPLSPRERTEET